MATKKAVRVNTVAPLPKVLAFGNGGATAALVVWLLGQYGGVETPGAVAAALATIVGAVAAYVMPPLELGSQGGEVPRSASGAPTPKVAAAAVGGALATVVVWLALVLYGVEISAEAGAALATVFGGLLGYVMPAGPVDGSQ